MINTTNVTIYLAMILDLEITGILMKQNFMIWTYFIGTRSNVSFAVFFFFETISGQYCTHYILCFECKTFVVFLISPDPSILLCLFLHFPVDFDSFTEDIFFPSNSFFFTAVSILPAGCQFFFFSQSHFSHCSLCLSEE